jgi:hypothetical protein
MAIRRAGLALAMVAAVALPACETVQTTQSGAVGVERKQAMLVSSDQVNNAAVSAYRQTMQSASQKGALNRNPAQVQSERRQLTRSERLVHAGRQDRRLHRYLGEAQADGR